jgi:hypothetical protein
VVSFSIQAAEENEHPASGEIRNVRYFIGYLVLDEKVTV